MFTRRRCRRLAWGRLRPLHQVRCGSRRLLRPLKNQMFFFGIVIDQIFIRYIRYIDLLFRSDVSMTISMTISIIWFNDWYLCEIWVSLAMERSVSVICTMCHAERKRGDAENSTFPSTFDKNRRLHAESRMLSPVRCYSASDAVHSVTRHHAELQSCIGGSHGWVQWKMQMILDGCWHQVFNKSGAVYPQKLRLKPLDHDINLFTKVYSC